MWLMLLGYRILARRFRARGGEIDLIARRGRLIVFCEVKAHRTAEAALAAVDEEARLRITRAARLWRSGRPHLAGCLFRFDILVMRPRRWPLRLRSAWEADLERVIDPARR